MAATTKPPRDHSPNKGTFDARFDVVLVTPQIATNTGNIIRLCANVGAPLHLVEPLGFSMDSALLRRAGLDYHELTTVSVHPSLEVCLRNLAGRRVFALSSRAATRYDQATFLAGDVFVFGAERHGLTPDQLGALGEHTRLKIPMRPDNRSLNLANAVAVVAYEAWRQHNFAGAAIDGAATSETTTSETTTSEHTGS